MPPLYLRSSLISLFSTALLALNGLHSVNALPTNYANTFVDPRFLLDKSAWSPNSTAAQQAIVSGAFEYAAMGPWAVTNKTILPPSKNIHDYLSFAPYYWPDCSNVHNKTELTQDQIWTECKYVNRDGQFVPDQHIVDNTGAIYTMGDAILYSGIAWAITRDGTHAANIAHWIDTWFINNDTVQTPNLNYAQLVRGVGMNVGVHTGILDFKGMAKIASAVLTLRLGGAPEYTKEIDDGFKAWLTEYLPWLRNNTLGVQERETPNNHGAFYYNQLSAIYLLLDDKAGAAAALDEFFKGIYQDEIENNGEQPLEASRTHPIHYRAYNLAAVTTNARIGAYIGYDAWNLTTKQNGTIQKATDWAMVQSPVSSNESAAAVAEIYPIVGCVATVYGDPTGKYKQYLSSIDPSEAFFFWDAHATINGTVPTTITEASTAVSYQPTSTSSPSKQHQDGGAPSTHLPRTTWFSAVVAFGIAGMISIHSL